MTSSRARSDAAVFLALVQNRPQGTSVWWDNADQQVTTMPVTHVVTPMMNTVVSSCSFLAFSCLDLAMAVLSLMKECHGLASFISEANTLHQRRLGYCEVLRFAS